MPHPDDLRFLRHAQTKGLLDEERATYCRDVLAQSEQNGAPQRVAQVLIRERIMASDHVAAILKEIRDVATGSQAVVGEETWAGQQLQAQSGPPVSIGDEVGGFSLTRELGRTGLWSTYEAKRDGRRFAIKILGPAVTSSDDLVGRFYAESERAHSLPAHPHLLPVVAFGSQGPLHFRVCDYVEAKSLADFVRPGRLAPKKCLEVCTAAAEALAFLHSQGMVHRDVKPSNILIGSNKAVHLNDLGLAKDSARVDAQLAQVGFAKLIGTPAYISPEQARGELEEISTASDVYSLGATIFRALTGRYPFAFNAYMRTIQAIALGPPPALSSLRPDAPPALNDLVLAAMSQDPGARPTATQFSQELGALLARERLLMPPGPPGAAV
ncbi:MAG: serine/threonine protein kinase [Planctomycetes bacterium]|nr:serine/threonine protein kinase [Planctomycetota bacterium]